MDSSSSDHPSKYELCSSSMALTSDQVYLCRDFKKPKKERGCTAKERISKMPPSTAGKRSSIYRGVTRHRWTGRYEAHLWDKSTWNQNQNKKGKQVYLGAYDDEEAAARAYDLAALKYWGPGTLINFPVSDYTRDLEEMQKFSREEYLASLRRKSSGFSRGISKYRGLSRCGFILKDAKCIENHILKHLIVNFDSAFHISCDGTKITSRWEPSYGRMAGSDYFESLHYGTSDDSAAKSEYLSGFSVDRKIDLTSYIKWWGSNKSRHADAGMKSSEEKKRGFEGDHCSELRTLEQQAQPTEPYQMPQLGTSHDEKKHKNSSVSALSILSRSAAYKSLLQKASKKEENITDTGENENKNAIDKLDRGKAVEKSSNHDGGNERPESIMGMSGALPLQKNTYNPLVPFLSAPLLTAYNTIDSLVDPLLWTSLVPMLPAGFPRNAEVTTKTEASSSYTVFQPDG